MSRSRADFLALFGPLFPAKEWPPLRLDPLLDSMQIREMEAGTTILREGQVCASVPFVLRGAIRVFKTAESGREITLYRIERGQTCILSASCGAGLAAFPANVVAERDTAAAFMPSASVRRLLDEGPSFRSFVLEQYSLRLAETIELVEEVAFRRVDERLAQRLAEAARSSPERRVALTHQELADRVGSSREVVSRILKDWEERGALEISRGSVRLMPAFEKLRLGDLGHGRPGGD